VNFKTIDSLFGNCAFCNTNLKRFWCEFTCHPYQKYFMNYNALIEKYPDVDFPVANLTMYIGNDVACDLFNACKKNPFVATLASGQSAPGFMQFMGTNAVQTGKTDITFRYFNDPEASMI
jgi:hypothetical protein